MTIRKTTTTTITTIEHWTTQCLTWMLGWLVPSKHHNCIKLNSFNFSAIRNPQQLSLLGSHIFGRIPAKDKSTCFFLIRNNFPVRMRTRNEINCYLVFWNACIRLAIWLIYNALLMRSFMLKRTILGVECHYILSIDTPVMPYAVVS